MRALILSDIHGNLEALDAVLAAAEGSYDTLWNLGDAVGYGASPNQVVDRLRPLARQNVRGNHDKVCAGIEPATGFNDTARTAAEWTATELTPASMTWLRTMVAGPVPVRTAMGEVGLAHGSPADEDVYILGIREAWEPLREMPQRCTFFGHTHIQVAFGVDAGRWFDVEPKHRRTGPSEWTFTLEDTRRYLINPGSVGQPRDRDPRAAFLILDDEARTVTFYRVPYDVDLAQGRILLAGLPEKLAERLLEGR
jgi:diadenosine tetraphosphatase ApaH/serine/threonine PP2A family protein phosphatase